MNYLTKIEIELSFPTGAHFYQNINNFIYKQYINYLYKLNCFASNQKCCSCPFNKECHYYHLTGNNFKYYPNIIINNNIFSKSIFHNEECVSITFYIIGKNDLHINYLKLFFESYLNQRLAGNFFYLKNFKISNIENKSIITNKIVLYSSIKSLDFIEEYNEMINYYNSNYDTNYNLLTNHNYNIKMKKNSKLDVIQFKTKTVKPIGYTYKCELDDCISISSDFMLIGIGNYNFIGGGNIEN